MEQREQCELVQALSSRDIGRQSQITERCQRIRGGTLNSERSELFEILLALCEENKRESLYA